MFIMNSDNLYDFDENYLVPFFSEHTTDFSPHLHVFQNNINKSNPQQHSILNDLVDDFDLILFQGPWYGFIGSTRSSDNTTGSPVLGTVINTSWTFIPLIQNRLPVPSGSVLTFQRDAQTSLLHCVPISFPIRM